jgi:hypothetical protein
MVQKTQTQDLRFSMAPISNARRRPHGIPHEAPRRPWSRAVLKLAVARRWIHRP